MHDPEVVAFSVRRPWPEIGRTYRRNPPLWKWRPGSPLVYVARKELYFPALLTVWHREPHGEDALQGECRGTRWQWHVHHWRIQFDLAQKWRRRLLTRCDWCGGRSTRRDAVNCSTSWDRPKSPWWRGERGLYHHECSAVRSAHRICLCKAPMLDRRDYGQCSVCGKYRGFRQEPTVATFFLATRIPEGARLTAADREFLEVLLEKDDAPPR